jgi:hypothetical protein
MFDGQDSDNNVTKIGDGRYRVHGWVDSQNSFGATLRADFAMVVERTAELQWELVSFQIKER